MTSREPMRAKLVPVLALAIPVAITVLVWLSAHEAPSTASHTTASVVDTSLGRGDAATSPSVATAFEARLAMLEAHVTSAPENRELRLELARLLHDGHREREAVEHYREALVMDPDDARVYFDLAAAYGAIGDWRGAEEVLMARLKAAPNDAVAMYDLGAVHANRGEVGEAEAWWRKAEASATDEGVASSVAHALARLEETRSR